MKGQVDARYSSFLQDKHVSIRVVLSAWFL